MNNTTRIDMEDVAEILNRINDALEETEYEAVGYDNTEGFLQVLIDRK
jgi:hypothetical protein